MAHGGQAVDVSGGEGDDFGALEFLGDHSWEEGVHGPGHGFLAGRAKFHARHVDDVGNIGEFLELLFIEEVAGDVVSTPWAFNSFAICAPLPEEKRETPMTFALGAAPPRGVDAAFEHAGEGGAHFSADAEDDEVAGEAFDGVDGRLGGGAEEIFEVGDISNGCFVRSSIRHC